ncbi:MAG: hypothetical protein LH474_07325 [Chamaesiphon sp.]|nr:hypothetical protein [Chamaesiphon sp.]
MKSFIYLTTISTAVIYLLLPDVVRAQSVFIQGFPSSGYSSTTIYSPSTETTTTTTVDRVNSNIYPGSNSVTTSTTTTYTGSSFRNRRQQGQSTIIFRNNDTRNTQVNCTTSIIGSPIPSPVALNPVTGGLCR